MASLLTIKPSETQSSEFVSLCAQATSSLTTPLVIAHRLAPPSQICLARCRSKRVYIAAMPHKTPGLRTSHVYVFNNAQLAASPITLPKDVLLNAQFRSSLTVTSPHIVVFYAVPLTHHSGLTM